MQACQNQGVNDHRIDMLLGVMARDAGHREEAIAHLRKAHELAPQELSPALELGFTLEAADAGEARRLYEAILTREPMSRPAQLGLARVARGQNRLTDAQTIYQRILSSNPNDPEALNGMAWLALARHDRKHGQAGFEHVLKANPDNEEAVIGLDKARDVYRYRVEASAVFVSTDQGDSTGFQAHGSAAISAFDSLEFGWMHASKALSTVSEIGLATLPSDGITIGYHRYEPRRYAASLVYDYRAHGDFPTEHWIDGGLMFYLADDVRWFGSYRRSFGDHLYKGRLIRTGLSVDVAPSWEVTATLYNSQQAAFRNNKDLWSGTFDVGYNGPRNLALSAGVGITPLIDSFDIHANAILPLQDHIAAKLVVANNSFNSAKSITAGLIFTW